MDVPFESFCALVYRLSHPSTPKGLNKPPSPAEIFSSWLNHLPRPFPPGTGKHILRLLFPHEGSRRRYGLKETRLAIDLERILCVEGLCRWDAVGWGEGGSGSLGKEVERAMRDRIPIGQASGISVRELDALLDKLAAHSAFSQLSQPPSSLPTTSDLLTTLFRDSKLSAYALAVLTQIILRDLRPLLNPLPSLRVSNPTAMLRIKSNAGPAQLELYTAMKCWDARMAEMYRKGMGDVDACADEVERMGVGAGCSTGPVLGVNVQIPKCLKGRSVDDALKVFIGDGLSRSARTVWAETKYDGYRMQIHVEVRPENDVRLAIFSKSRRNATVDRLNTHAIVLSTLGLPVPTHLPVHPSLASRTSPPRKRIARSIILEAEVVPYNEGSRAGGRGPGVEEFWWLGAAGVTAEAEQPRNPADRDRHLCLFFFDVLLLDGTSLLHTPLERRRRILEDFVAIVPGFSHLAAYSNIPLDQGKRFARSALQVAFDKSIHRREEGLVLKAPSSTYMDSRWRWVKLKKDYIPNLGDCIDLVLLGAGWDADRARDLRVDTSVFTSFYVGVLTNHAAVKAKLETPHFEVIFKVSYGLSRAQLEEVNGCIRHGRWGTKRYDKDDRFKRRLLGLSWTYTMRRDLSAPSVLFERPMCCEVMGAGFQRIAGSKLYELRWPRLQKIWEVKERSWIEALTATSLLQEAHKALGYAQSANTPSPSPRDDSIKALWRSSSATNLTDIPDMPTPSPGRPSPRRMQSAPDLREMIKASPGTPTRRQAAPRERLFDLIPAQAKHEEEPSTMEVETGLERLGNLSPSGRHLSYESSVRTGRATRSVEPMPARALTEVMLDNIVCGSDGKKGTKRSGFDIGAEKSRKRSKAKPLSLRTRLKMACRTQASERALAA